MKTINIYLLAILAVGCNKTPTPVTNGNTTTCGTGTTLVNGVCTSPAQTTCGTGTTLVNGVCTDPAETTCAAGTTLTNGACVPNAATVTYVQVDHLGRPGINEALLITNDFHNGYNATAPSFTGVPADTLNQVVGEAKTVLKAIYLGSCLVSGTLGLTAGPAPSGTALKPGLVPCADVGGNVFEGGNAITGTVVSATSKAGAQTYADKTFAQFVPDVMRINTGAPSNYLTPCGDPTTPSPLLCGGRNVDDDVIDVTYNYLIGGLAGTAGPKNSGDATAAQVRALTSDGVAYDSTPATGPTASTTAHNKGLTDGVATNSQQGHPAPSATFPYSAAPF